MFNWLTSWFYTSPTIESKITSTSIDVKKEIENKPIPLDKIENTQITLNDINNKLQNLNKTPIIEKSTIYQGSPLMDEFDKVFKMGYKEYFEQRKNKY